MTSPLIYPPSALPLIHDSYLNGWSNGTTFSTFTPGLSTKGRQWSVPQGSWSVSSNIIYGQSAAGSIDVATIHTGADEYLAEATLTLPNCSGNAYVGFYLDWTDINNNLALFFNGAASTTIEVWQVVGGGYSLLGSATASISKGANFTTRFSRHGASFRVTAGGAVVATDSASTPATGKVSLLAMCNGSITSRGGMFRLRMWGARNS